MQISVLSGNWQSCRREGKYSVVDTPSHGLPPGNELAYCDIGLKKTKQNKTAPFRSERKMIGERGGFDDPVLDDTCRAVQSRLLLWNLPLNERWSVICPEGTQCLCLLSTSGLGRSVSSLCRCPVAAGSSLILMVSG